MDKCVQMWTRNYGALGQTARVCFGVLCANKKEDIKRDFGDLRIRRREGRVVNTPLMFKRVLLERREKRRRPERRGRGKRDKRVRERERPERERRRKETEREPGRERVKPA
ncbi:hypothetical protein TNCV_1334081 [Trichonephila clavipes]|nr:hypothetical protein TNCV_1334081 [Trichonephila clavipes]